MIIYCKKCNVKVAELAHGSKIKKKAIMLCDNCETQRKALEIIFQGIKNNPFENNDFFKWIFKK